MMQRRSRRAALMVTMAMGFAIIAPGHPLAQSTVDRTASISGIVVDDTGAPVTRALLGLTGRDLPGARTAVSDDDGRFVFRAVPPGQFSLVGSKALLVSAEFGQGQPDGLGTPIRIVAGQQMRDVQLRLPRAGSIAGTIVDGRGEPVRDVSVIALRIVRRMGEATEIRMGVTSIDAAGGFRVSGLPAGTYRISAARGRSNGVTVTLGEGESRAALVLQMEPPSAAPTGVIGGTALGLDGRPVPNLSVRLVSIDTNPPQDATYGAPETRPSPMGTFRYTGVADGRYVVVARASVSQGRPGAFTFLTYWASGESVVTGGASSPVALTLRPGITLSGRIVFAGTALTPPNLARVNVALSTRDSRASMSYATAGNVASDTSADGLFTVRGVPPGHYSFRLGALENLLDGWFIESASVNGVDAMDAPLTVGIDDIMNIDIRVSDRAGAIEGTVTDRANRPTTSGTVVVFPVDERAWLPGARRIRATRADTSGIFAVSGLPSGEYFATVVPAIEPDEWYEPGVLARLRMGATRVTVGNRDAARVTLRLQ